MQVGVSQRDAIHLQGLVCLVTGIRVHLAEQQRYALDVPTGCV